ncbi:MAG: tRNA-(ms[2]io[6]A)-hydroxylase [Oligoflexales bacterium]
METLLEILPLKSTSSDKWLQEAVRNFDEFVVDHAACERKASALAMSFVVKFSDKTKLIEPMVSLAREELAHFHEVYRLIIKRGLALGMDEKDPYVKLLLKRVRHGRDEYFLDRLLVGSVIEARGCERFLMMGRHLEDPVLAQFYHRLGREEAGHYKIFLKIAYQYFPREEVDSRMDFFLDAEAESIEAVPVRARVH